ncbi:MAG: acyltransferase [Desulfobacteraceae bacterium]|nr:acyltransferase [Desulfobacteraceae bacterium]
MKPFRLIPGPLRGVLVLSIYLINTLFWTLPLFSLTLLKFVIPVPAFRRFVTRILHGLAAHWVAVNNFTQRLFCGTQWEVTGLENLRPRGWYLVVANHQSWVDILVLQRVFNRRIPLLTFFIKKELIWFPLLGQAWWALDFPFMKRHSTAYLKKHPEKRGEDIAAAQKACEKFKHQPIALMNFIEGTRFSPEKKRRSGSPYANLLRTKAGGMALVLNTAGQQLHRILDVTIVYPDGRKSFWEFACGKIGRIHVQVDQIPVSPWMIGDYVEDRVFRRKFQAWLNDLWTQKDQRITALLDATRTADSGMRAHPGAEAPHAEELQSDSRKAVQSMP